jgi:hypothetical protein
MELISNTCWGCGVTSWRLDMCQRLVEALVAWCKLMIMLHYINLTNKPPRLLICCLLIQWMGSWHKRRPSEGYYCWITAWSWWGKKILFLQNSKFINHGLFSCISPFSERVDITLFVFPTNIDSNTIKSSKLIGWELPVSYIYEIFSWTNPYILLFFFLLLFLLSYGADMALCL